MAAEFNPSLQELREIAAEARNRDERAYLEQKAQELYGRHLQARAADPRFVDLGHPPQPTTNAEIKKMQARVPDGFLVAGKAAPGVRAVPLNQVQALRKEKMLDWETRRLFKKRGVSGDDVTLYAKAVRYKATALDAEGDAKFPEVLRAFGHLKDGGVLTNVGVAHEPLVPIIAAAAWRYNQAGWFRAWVDADAREARGPGAAVVHFGRYKGERISQLPEGYLDWLQRVLPEARRFLGDMTDLYSQRNLGGDVITADRVRVPDLENPAVPEQYKRPLRGTYFDPVDLVRRFRRSGKEVPSFKVRLEDYAGMRVSDLRAKAPHVLHAVERVLTAMTRESFVSAFESYVSSPGVSQRLRERAEYLGSRGEAGEFASRQQRPRTRDSADQRRFENPTTEPERAEAFLLRGQRLPEVHRMADLQALKERRETVSRYLQQSPGAVKGHMLSKGAVVTGFPAPEDLDESRKSYDSVKAWATVTDSLVALEECWSADDARTISRAPAVQAALDVLPDAVRREFQSEAARRIAALRARGRVKSASRHRLERGQYHEERQARGGRVIRKDVEED